LISTKELWRIEARLFEEFVDQSEILDGLCEKIHSSTCRKNARLLIYFYHFRNVLQRLEVSLVPRFLTLTNCFYKTLQKKRNDEKLILKAWSKLCKKFGDITHASIIRKEKIMQWLLEQVNTSDAPEES